MPEGCSWSLSLRPIPLDRCHFKPHWPGFSKRFNWNTPGFNARPWNQKIRADRRNSSKPSFPVSGDLTFGIGIQTAGPGKLKRRPNCRSLNFQRPLKKTASTCSPAVRAVSECSWQNTWPGGRPDWCWWEDPNRAENCLKA